MPPMRHAIDQVQNVTPDMSLLEMLDLLNENLQTQGEAPVCLNTIVAREFADRAGS